MLVRPFRSWLLRTKANTCPAAAIEEICRRCTYGDWLLLFTLKNVVDCFFYDEILEELGEKLKLRDQKLEPYPISIKE